MNMTTGEAAELAQPIVQHVGQEADIHVLLCPPFTSLPKVGEIVASSNVLLGAQNMHFELGGAFTGEVSPSMLRDLFTTYVILGHSERRQFFGETDEIIGKKVSVAMSNSLKPIVCVGETLEEREAGKTLEVVGRQIKECLAGIVKGDADELVIAYEPVWAIGTGKTATPEMAQEVHSEIRKLLVHMFDADAASLIRILYGGSMKPANAEELLAMPDVDGGLIGGASLEAKQFMKLIDYAQAAARSKSA